MNCVIDHCRKVEGFRCGNTVFKMTLPVELLGLVWQEATEDWIEIEAAGRWQSGWDKKMIVTSAELENPRQGDQFY